MRIKKLVARRNTFFVANLTNTDREFETGGQVESRKFLSVKYNIPHKKKNIFKSGFTQDSQGSWFGGRPPLPLIW